MRLLGLLVLAVSAFAQPVTVGIRAGARINNDIESGATSESKPYLAGPMVEVRLPHHLAVEVDALYRRFGYSSQVTLSVLRDPFTKQPLTNVYTQRVRANSWEFPLLAKYRFEAPVFLLAGYAPRHIGGRFQDSGYLELNSAGQAAPLTASGPASFPANHAVVIGAGAGWRMGPLRIEPELRYLRWKDALASSFDPASPMLGSRNELQLLIGIGWSGK